MAKSKVRRGDDNKDYVEDDKKPVVEDDEHNVLTNAADGTPMEDDASFEVLGLDSRLIRALKKKKLSITKPTPIQRVAIPLILEGKDVVARAKTGSGKTLAYLLPLLQKLLNLPERNKRLSPSSIILVPSGELCQQVYNELMCLIDVCKFPFKIAKLNSNMSNLEMNSVFAGLPDILVSSPSPIAKCISSGVILSSSLSDSLEIVVLDEADLLLSFGYEADLNTLTTVITRRCQCLLMSATSSDDVDKLKKLILHNPYVLTLPEVEGVKDDAIPKSVQQFWISCVDRDKMLYALALLKLELVQKRVLIFTNNVDSSFQLKLFLEKFGIKSAVLNSELPQNSRLHILEEFNSGLFDYLIATDDAESKGKGNDNTNAESKKRKRRKPKIDSEFGVVRGIDFKNVHTVINYNMPPSVCGYIHRIGRTGRAHSSGTSVSLVSGDEMEVFEEVMAFVKEGEKEGISLFPLLTKNAVESLRYRAEDTAKSVTKIAVREARAQDLRNELLNSEKLKAHFSANPRDLDLLKHDKVLSKETPSHLRAVPDYLRDAATVEASKMVSLASAAMGIHPFHRSRRPSKRRRNGGDPLKSVGGRKIGRRG